MTLAGGRLLDIEFNEIKSGYRLRYSPENQKTYVDIFLFNGLSSGAGYCSALAERTIELMQETRTILNSCPNNCDSACHECLIHYWNQRVHSLLDRNAANELLDWCENSELPNALTYEQQDELLSPLNALGAEFTVYGDDQKHFIEFHGTRIEIMAIPSMWGEYSGLIPENVIAISDKLLKYALPKADALIRSKLH